MSRMKIKVLCRNPRDYVRQRSSDIHKLPRNLDPALHPHEGPREYVRALNAAKLDRVFAKPFLCNLSGHTDGVYTISKHPKLLSVVLSGSCDGEVRIWSLASQRCLRRVAAHEGFVRGVSVNREGTSYFTVGEDKVIKQWPMTLEQQLEEEEEEAEEAVMEPVATILGKSVFLGIDCHWSEDVFATCGEKIDIWDGTRSEPVRSFTWGPDSITSLRFNPVEFNLLATVGSDRAVALYDIRQPVPLRKVVLSMRSNAVAWNPMEPLNFTVANEDSNLYSFDMRWLDRSRVVHKDHVMAVMDLDYSPTGTEFVSGSFDKTLRVFGVEGGHSREIYHTKRMQRVFSVAWSNDGTYLLSGSDETNLRLWKASASEKIGKLHTRERAALDYASSLREKYKHHPQIRRIARHRHVPRLVYKQARERRVMLASARRKARNVARHSRSGSNRQPREKTKNIVSIV